MNNMDEHERLALGRMVVNVLEEWGIDASDAVSILALPGKVSGRHLRR